MVRVIDATLSVRTRRRTTVGSPLPARHSRTATVVETSVHCASSAAMYQPGGSPFVNRAPGMARVATTTAAVSADSIHSTVRNDGMRAAVKRYSR
jgi:hypothetical protein